MNVISRDFRGAIISVIMPCSIRKCNLYQLLMINQESHDKVVRLTKKITRQKKKHRNQPDQPRPDGLGMISMLFLLTRYFFVNRTPYHAITSNNKMMAPSSYEQTKIRL